MTKISIITVNYNNKIGLKATIDSVVGQTYEDYEFIIIDGGSTDGSVDVIVKSSDYVDYWVSERDNGVYNGMNKGIAVAHGEYCIFMNSGDCFYSDSVLEQIFSVSQSADYVSGDYVTKSGVASSPKTLTLRYMWENAVCHQAVFIRTALLKAHPYNEDYRIAADWAQMFDELILRDASYHYIHIIVAILQPDGISVKGWKELAADRKRHLKEALPTRVYEAFQRMQLQDQISTKQSKLFSKILYLSSSPIMTKIVGALVSILYDILKKRNKKN